MISLCSDNSRCFALHGRVYDSWIERLKCKTTNVCSVWRQSNYCCTGWYNIVHLTAQDRSLYSLNERHNESGSRVPVTGQVGTSVLLDACSSAQQTQDAQQ